MKKDLRGHVVELRGRTIPRDEKGDPAFTHLALGLDVPPGQECTTHLLGQFTPAEVVEMCNRYLYQQEYQRTAHRGRARKEADKLQPLKQTLYDLFGVTYLHATDTQMKVAAKHVSAVKTDTEEGR